MQYRFLILFFLFFFSSYSNAQDRNFEVGIRSGVNLADIRDFSITDFDLAPANFLNAGVYYRYIATRTWHFQFEISYSVKGGERPTNLRGEQYSVKQIYLSFPILLQYQAKNLILESGLEYGHKLSTVVSSDIDNGAHHLPESVWSNSSDFSFNFGLAYQFYRFSFGVRKSYGLSNLIKFDVVDNNGVLIKGKNFAKNDVVQLCIGYQL